MPAALEEKKNKRRQVASGAGRRHVQLPPELWAWLVFSGLVSCLVLLGLFNGRAMYRVYKTENQPIARKAAALEMLGVTSLPPGYHAAHVFLMSVRPFMFGEQIELSDRQPDADGVTRGFTSRGFIYHHFSDENAMQNQQMRDLDRTRAGVRFEGWTRLVRVEGREHIRSGEIEVKGVTVDYVTQRAVLVHPDVDLGGLITVFAIRCPDQRTRTGIWFGPDPDAVTPIEDLELTGTVADETAMAAFLGAFSFCP